MFRGEAWRLRKWLLQDFIDIDHVSLVLAAIRIAYCTYNDGDVASEFRNRL